MDIADQLARAAGDGDVTAVVQLLGAGAEVDAPFTAGRTRTALDLAVHAGHTETVRVLLAAGADLGQRAGEYGELTPLCLAALCGHTAVVEVLLDAGAPTGTQGRMGYVPLVLAATATEHGHPQTVDALLRRGVDINGVMKDKTPLEWATAFGQVQMAQQLLARGAAPTAKALSGARAGAERYPEAAERYALIVGALHAAGIED
ncbi:ankyrin repeat domain-containing protein [Streptomyces sp. HB132]|uniref:ankyrin repeat domain-containing protein n=1 Tax=Streptomyces sp. HB132 TaxID=767388 RepID=UPI00196176D2|nr:ankyrin repeat domain-containing protein [Streptomyces sp. HB132]MBM7440406.1 ankyrin repeat protein [Streptomyces sp. HB132]